MAAEAFEAVLPPAAQAESGGIRVPQLAGVTDPRGRACRDFHAHASEFLGGSGLCLGFSLDPDIRHYPDRDTKKRLNNSPSMPEFLGISQLGPCGALPSAPALGMMGS
ncbi:hypothetical protein [Arthrobacter methylotrophus]|uniref:hypothetical protein n=1 Tax=Arthrobacter methylotrophus TaxID=121291 RepID=UPI0031E54D9C